MSATNMLILAVFILTVLDLLVFALFVVRLRRIPKTTPNGARLIMRSGATLDLVDDDGNVCVKVVLDSVTRGMNGTTALFVDYFNWTKRSRSGF